MSGKPYTMKEMKDIVVYLTEHKAYSEIKGRKMWMDLASSDTTTRTWQSLKETFLKRILPDIHNPYYKLTVHQLASFKQGCDIEAKLNNKLEIRSSDAVSNTEDNNMVTDHAEKGKENNEDIPTGEDPLDTKARDSTDTLILENNDQTGEDLKTDLQSANEDDDKEGGAQPKSLRDLITYSEPLNMLQTTIEDFATDEEGSNGEPQMQIVEHEEVAKKDNSGGDNCIVEIPDSDSGENEKTNQSSAKQDTDVVALPKKNNEKSADNITDNVVAEINQDNRSEVLFPENNLDNKTNEAEDINNDNKNDNQRKSSDITENTNTITDSLPSNQEAFQNKTKQASEKGLLSISKKDVKKSRKRASSQESFQPKDSKRKNLSIKKQSISDSDTVAIRKDKKIKLNPKIIEENLNKTEETSNPVSSEMLMNNGKTTESATVNATDLESQDVEMITSDIENPCLKSVSLYEEELTYNKNKESQREKKVNSKEQPKNDKINDDNEIVILKSHSDSISESSKVQTSPKKRKQEVTKQRRDAMADVFGLSRGGVSKKRKRTVSYKQSSHQSHHISSGSSEWTSESDSEFISPPRGRKNKQTRKYLKPRPARILSLEEEGGLFVMYGKKIYPIVKDGKIIKNYVTYTPDEEVDQEESYWKLKYVEQKKRIDELTKLLNEVKETTENDVKQTSAFALTEKQKDVAKVKQHVPEAAQSKTESEDKTVKFKFIKNNEELQLEGHWSHVNPVLAQVMQLLQKDEKNDMNKQTNPSTTSNEEKAANQNKSNINGTKTNLEAPVTQKSGQTTPIIPLDVEDDIKERVDKIESEIFKEIEEKDIEEATNNKTSQLGDYVTKRRGRPRRSSVTTSSTSVSGSPLKKPKLGAEPNKDKEITETNTKTTSKTRITEPPKKSLNDSPKETTTRKSLSRKSKEVASSNLNKTVVGQVRYKFPSPPPSRKSKKANIYLTSLEPKVHSLPESRSFCSVDSTQEYQESDESGLRMSHRKRKRISTAPYKKKSLNRYRTNLHPFLTDDITSESSNSYQSSPLKSMTFQNSTISSNNYNSESYRLLINKNNSQKQVMFQSMERIDEIPNLNELKSISEQIYADIMSNDVEMPTDRNMKDGTFKITHTDEDSTSNMSLPTSPVLSIVENISVSKDLLSSVDDFSVDKFQCSNQIILNDFIKSETDVSMPLMARECAIETNGQNGGEYHYNLSAVKNTPMTETFLNKVNTVNIKDPTLSDSINTKLKDLMLESTKKTLKAVCGSDQNNNIADEKGIKGQNMQTKSRKRSSTPRKSKSSRRLNLANKEPCIEEHTESCSYSRKSCPPVVQYFENIDINSNFTQNIVKSKSRQKKDVIKVKITKPKQRSVKKSVKEKISEEGISNLIDRSVNASESGAFLHCFNDSVDLIHNHSETCLNAHDCMGDSVELVEDSKSVILLDSTANSENLLRNNLEYELFSNDAQDGSELQKGKTSPTVYHSLCLSSQNSLITEDLSDGSPVIKNIQDGGNKISRNTKWYLLSEDETTNTNCLDINHNSAKSLGYGANLNQLFPITCAVPDLSTITEVSNQNGDNSKKLGT